MVKSDLKKSIDAHIGKERWMTASLANKMANHTQKKKSPRFNWIPITVTLIACALIFILINMNNTAIQPTANSALQDTNILKHIDDPAMGEALMDYLKAIESKDEKKIIEYSKESYENNDAKAIIAKYEHVQFNSIQLLQFTKNEPHYIDEHFAYLLVNVDNENTTYLHMLSIQKRTDGWKIVDSTFDEKIVYEPFVMPSFLGFHYEPTRAFEKDDSYKMKDLALRYPSIQLTENMSAHFYEENHALATLVIQKGDNYYPITELPFSEKKDVEQPFSISTIKNADGLDYFVLSTGDHNKFMTLFYNESIDKFQAIWVEDGSEMYFSDVDGNGISEVLINTADPVIATVEVGQLVMSYPIQNFNSYIASSFVDIKFYQDTIALKYEDLNGEKYANYKWKTVNEAPFVNNEKIDGLFE